MPSIQTESELWIRNGPAPSRGSAFLTPPPVSSRAARSSEISMAGARRALQVLLDQVGLVVHVDDGALDAGRGQPVEHVIDQRLAAAAARAAWARASLAGAMRVPSPALSTIAVSSVPAIACNPSFRPQPGSFAAAHVGREVPVVPRRQRQPAAGARRLRARYPQVRGMCWR